MTSEAEILDQFHFFGEPTTLGVAEAIWYVKNVCEAEPTWTNVRAILFKMLPLILHVPASAVTDKFAAETAESFIRYAVAFGCVDADKAGPHLKWRLSIDDKLAQQIAARHADVKLMPSWVRWDMEDHDLVRYVVTSWTEKHERGPTWEELWEAVDNLVEDEGRTIDLCHNAALRGAIETQDEAGNWDPSADYFALGTYEDFWDRMDREGRW